MNFKPIRKDDFDKSFKFERQSFLCYSEKKLREIEPDEDYVILGLARKSNKDTGCNLMLGGKMMPVFRPDNKDMMYKSIGFLPIEREEDEKVYIAIQESSLPFAAALGTMAAATAMICAIIANPTPTNGPIGPAAPEFLANPSVSDSAPRFNPLPPVDPNLENSDESPEIVRLGNSEVSEDGGKVTISYKPDAKLTLSTGEIKMEYQNPSTSSHDAVVTLYVVSGGQEYEIAKSGRIPAGNKLKTMQLTAQKNLFGGEGKYNAMYKVSYYDRTTGEKALAEADITDITITVRK